MAKLRSRAFTLAELLIALAILGVIATFAVPKVLQAQADSKKYALFKETLALLQQVVYEGNMTGKINQNQGAFMYAYMKTRANFVKYCTDGLAEGCFSQPFPAAPAERSQEAFILASGVTVGGLSGGWDPGGTNAWEDGIIIDVNGAAGPNQDGDDQMYIVLCIGPNSCWGGALKPSQINGNSAISAPYLQQIYTR